MRRKGNGKREGVRSTGRGNLGDQERGRAGLQMERVGDLGRIWAGQRG